MTTKTKPDCPPQPNLTLASASPRRRELLAEKGFEFDVITSPLEEPTELAGCPTVVQTAEALSFFKARSVADNMETGIVLGADTVVSLNGHLIGKPIDRDDAGSIITALAGTTHDVITGVAVVDAQTGRRLIQSDTTSIQMKPLSQEEIEAYLDTGGWKGKAGAYGIQDYGDAFVARIEGSYSNVVGLPVTLTIRLLADFGVKPSRPATSLRQE